VTGETTKMVSDFQGPDEARPSLRLSVPEQLRLLGELEQQARSSPDKDKRRSERVAVPDSVAITVRLTHPGGGVDQFLVRGRNVSDHGLGFLHGSFLHEDTHCAITFRRDDGESVQLEGKVRRCRYLAGGAHEVGVAFNHAFPMREFLDADDQPTRNKVPTSRFDGQVVLVDDCDASRRLHNFMLTTLGLGVLSFDRGEDALAALQQGPCAMLMTDIWMQPMDGFALLTSAREARPDTQVVAVTCDERPEVQQRIREAGFAALLEKPVAFPRLVEAIKPIVPERKPVADQRDPDALISSRWGEPELRPLITAFVQDLAAMYTVLDAALHTPEPDAALTPDVLARQIAVGAEAHGFEPLQQTADELCQLIRQAQSDALVEPTFHQLRRQIDHARQGLAQQA